MGWDADCNLLAGQRVAAAAAAAAAALSRYSRQLMDKLFYPEQLLLTVVPASTCMHTVNLSPRME